MDTKNAIPANLARLQESLLKTKEELKAREAETELKLAAAQGLHSKLRALNGNVDRLEEQVIAADQQLATFEARLVDLERLFLDMWGNPSLPHGPEYREIASVRAAIADYPRVKGHLLDKLEAAKAALVEFEQQNLE